MTTRGLWEMVLTGGGDNPRSLGDVVLHMMLPRKYPPYCLLHVVLYRGDSTIHQVLHFLECPSCPSLPLSLLLQTTRSIAGCSALLSYIEVLVLGFLYLFLFWGHGGETHS